MHPGQARRIRHERHRASGAPLTVTRHGRAIGQIVWTVRGWVASAELPGRGVAGVGTHGDPVRAEMAIVDYAKARE